MAGTETLAYCEQLGAVCPSREALLKSKASLEESRDVQPVMSNKGFVVRMLENHGSQLYTASCGNKDVIGLADAIDTLDRALVVYCNGECMADQQLEVIADGFRLSNRQPSSFLQTILQSRQAIKE